MNEPSDKNAPSKNIWRRDLAPGFPPFRWCEQAFRWLSSRRGLRCMLIVFAWTATIVALLYAEENWRGRHAWNKMRRELETKGESLDWTTFIPKTIPDDQNFAATPLVQSWFPKGRLWDDDFDRVEKRLAFDQQSDQKAPTSRQFLDLVAWQRSFEAIAAGQRDQRIEAGKLDRASRAAAAPAILAFLKTNEAAMTELRLASQRPSVRYPVVYDLNDPWAILIPHLAKIKGWCVRLQLRASAELAAGQNEGAFDDVTLMLYLADSLKNEPFLISYLVRLACLHVATQVIWEGLAQHAWSDAQLQTLQNRLQQYDVIADLKRSLTAERAAGILTVELIRKKGLGYLVKIGGPGGATPKDSFLANLAGRFVPGGWYYQEQYNYCRLAQLQFDGAFDTSQRTVSPHQIRINTSAVRQELPEQPWGKLFLHHKSIAALMSSSVPNIPLKTAEAETVVDQAALACALERYRLANGRFPESLDALAPRFISPLPHDVINGQPLRYRRTDDGQFILYSVGWNEKDDGGTPGVKLFDENRGDWVW
jgi:hypothetical protein